MKHSAQKALDITDLSYNPRVFKTTKEGYIYRKIPNHPNCTKEGYVLEHRFVVEKELGRFLDRKEVVHHINHIRNDNRIENLTIYKSSGVHIREEHTSKDQFGRFKKPGQIVFDIRKGKYISCKVCSKQKYLLPSRLFTQFCSRKCMGIFYRTSRLGVGLGKKRTQEVKEKLKKAAARRKRDSRGVFVN